MKFVIMRIRIVLYLVFPLIFLACSEEGNSQSASGSDDLLESDNLTTEAEAGDIWINEFSPIAGEINEFGEGSDWIELYNSTEQDIKFEEGSWSISDNPNKPAKYIIPEMVIKSKGFVLLWCDGEEVVDEDVHTSFKLSSKGESISLFFNELLMDEYVYDSLGKEYQSVGRASDGGADWIMNLESTPGYSNN
jgi:hypothetical protein